MTSYLKLLLSAMSECVCVSALRLLIMEPLQLVKQVLGFFLSFIWWLML